MQFPWLDSWYLRYYLAETRYWEMEVDGAKYSTLRRGLLEFLILAIVSNEKVYTAELLQRLSETDFATQEGTLYPLLSKMRRQGLLDYEWHESASGPPRKYYKLTRAGREQLAEFRQYWQQLTSLIDQLGQ